MNNFFFAVHVEWMLNIGSESFEKKKFKLVDKFASNQSNNSKVTLGMN